jgi:hypothetical protein
MLTRKFVDIYGYISIAIMVVLLLLVWSHGVPREMYLPLFYFALFLFIVRVVLRFLVVRAERAKENTDRSATDRQE